MRGGRIVPARHGGAGIPPLYANASFENFLLPRDNPIGYRELTEVFWACAAMPVNSPTAKRPGSAAHGRAGNGQDASGCRRLPRHPGQGFEGLFFDYQNLLDRIRSGYDEASNSSDKEAYRVAMETEVLLLDDLGAHRVTDWVEDTVTSIITYRCNNRKPLIATTNLIDADAGYGKVVSPVRTTERR